MDAEKERRRTLKRAENIRKKRWRRKKKQQQCFRDPFGTVKEILSPRSNVQPDVSEELLNRYLAETVGDKERDVTLGQLDNLPEIGAPEIEF